MKRGFGTKIAYLWQHQLCRLSPLVELGTRKTAWPAQAAWPHGSLVCFPSAAHRVWIGSLQATEKNQVRVTLLENLVAFSRSGVEEIELFQLKTETESRQRLAFKSFDSEHYSTHQNLVFILSIGTWCVDEWESRDSYKRSAVGYRQMSPGTHEFRQFQTVAITAAKGFSPSNTS